MAMMIWFPRDLKAKVFRESMMLILVVWILLYKEVDRRSYICIVDSR
jgi:hypothetical protein